MLIRGYRWEFCRPPNPQAQHLRGVAYLDKDIGELLPYLNTVLRGDLYCQEPPSLILKYRAKLINISARQIAINILRDEEEAEEIIRWLVEVINETWEKRGKIAPSCRVAPKPRVLEILKLLPRSNCRACGYPTCMVFAVRVSEGKAVSDACPVLSLPRRQALQEYLGKFSRQSAEST